MRALKLFVFGDGQSLINTLPRSAYRVGDSAGRIALGAFRFPDLVTRKGLRSRLRRYRTLIDFEMATFDYCVRTLRDQSPRVLLLVFDARESSHMKDAFASARVVASNCVAVAAMETGREMSILAAVVRSNADVQSLTCHIDQGHFDALRVDGLTVFDAQRLRDSLPCDIQAETLL